MTHPGQHEQAVEAHETGGRVLQIPSSHGDEDRHDGHEVDDA